MGTPASALIANRIDQRRSELGITVADLAERADIPRTTLQRRLAGNGKPFDTTELERMSSTLDQKISVWVQGL
jgi:transcriptional regulator with XRE-family HTH domain